MIIAVDFDGTCVTHEFPHVGRDIGAVPVLRALAANGHKLILYTMRCDFDGTEKLSGSPTGSNEPRKYLTDAINWFLDNRIPLYGIQTEPTQKEWTTSPKCYAHMIIDDTSLGCPLIQPPGDARPYVDWVEVAFMLRRQGLIKVKNERTKEFKIN